MNMSATKRHPRKMRSPNFGLIRHGNLLFALFAIALQIGQVQVKAECPKHGCVLTAVDILYDESTQGALSILRESQDDNKREQALSTLQSAGDDSKTTLTLRGYKGGKLEDQVNQDRAFVVSPFKIGSNSVDPKPVAQLLGVFDGHGTGGEKTSQYAVDNVSSLLAAKLATIADQEQGDSYDDSRVVAALKETFDELDKNDPSFGAAGCTATVILRLGQKLFIANAGDR